MAKKEPKKPAPKRAEGKKIFNYAFYISDVDAWRERSEQENRSLTNLIETVMNDYVKNVKV